MIDRRAELKRDRKAVRAKVSADGLASVLNDTKWRELCDAMRSFAGFLPRFRIKDLLGMQPSEWDGEWYYHPYPYFSIEWLQIDSMGHLGEVTQALIDHNIPFSRDGEYLRVWGYTLPGSPPKFEG